MTFEIIGLGQNLLVLSCCQSQVNIVRILKRIHSENASWCENRKCANLSICRLCVGDLSTFILQKYFFALNTSSHTYTSRQTNTPKRDIDQLTHTDPRTSNKHTQMRQTSSHTHTRQTNTLKRDTDQLTHTNPHVSNKHSNKQRQRPRSA